MEIMQQILDELHARCAYRADEYGPHYVSSYAIHAFNIMNRKREIYWESANLPNMRIHVIFVSPSGYMKSYFMGQFAGRNNGIFTNAVKFPIGHKQTMSEANFIGTIQIINGQAVTSDGAAFTFKDGLVVIDEFSAITNSFKSTYNNQMDSQLLAALDHGWIEKGLASGNIKYNTALTLWAGVQPSRYDLDSGFGRRLWYLTFVPNKKENDALHDAQFEGQNVRLNVSNMAKLWSNIDKWVDTMDIIERIEFTREFNETKKSMGAFAYEAPVFNRFVLGWHLATYGADKKIVVDVKDSELMKLIKSQKTERDYIMNGIEPAQLGRIIREYGNLKDKLYHISVKEISKKSIMLGWNNKKVSDVLMEMVKGHSIVIKSGNIEMDEDYYE